MPCVITGFQAIFPTFLALAALRFLFLTHPSAHLSHGALFGERAQLVLTGADGAGKKQIVLTEAERQQKREETARRRKRQSEQKLQDEQVRGA